VDCHVAVLAVDFTTIQAGGTEGNDDQCFFEFLDSFHHPRDFFSAFESLVPFLCEIAQVKH
jgi:hypothetical protein